MYDVAAGYSRSAGDRAVWVPSGVWNHQLPAQPQDHPRSSWTRGRSVRVLWGHQNRVGGGHSEGTTPLPLAR